MARILTSVSSWRHRRWQLNRMWQTCKNRHLDKPFHHPTWEDKHVRVKISVVYLKERIYQCFTHPILPIQLYLRITIHLLMYWQVQFLDQQRGRDDLRARWVATLSCLPQQESISQAQGAASWQNSLILPGLCLHGLISRCPNSDSTDMV